VQAATTSRHLSFIESGRSQPSREMVLRLARVLDVPIRERNQLPLALFPADETTAAHYW
jgi:transcriptional regulator with XRE-family HTH domain